MTIIFEESFEPYIVDAPGLSTSITDRATQGVWAALQGQLVAPGIGPRTGTVSWRPTSNSQGRRVLGSTYSELFVSLGLFFDELPAGDNIYSPITLRDVSNNDICRLYVQADGAFEITNGAGVTLLRGSAVVTAGTWHHVQARFVRSATVGACEVRLNAATVLAASNLDLGTANFAQYVARTVGTGTSMYIDDIVINDTAGASNNTWLGTTRVYAQRAIADTSENAWYRRKLSKFGGGVIGNSLNKAGSDISGGIFATDGVQYELGSSDYTIEAFVNFTAFPASQNTHTLLCKWAESSNNREWRLFHDGDNIKFQYTTDGTSTTITTVHDFPWLPNFGQYYHIAVSRSAGVSRLFIDGVQYGTPKVDAATYFAGAARLGIFTQASTSGIVSGDQLPGFMDEVRITNGVSRYAAPFTPTTVVFPRGSLADPEWANVALLIGADNALEDESDHDASLTGLTSINSHFDAGRVVADDADFAYQLVTQQIARDYTYIQAPLVQATSQFIATENPGDTLTATINGRVYTFRTALTAADDILIGATTDDTLINFIAAINGEAGEGTLYGTGTAINADVLAELANTGTMRIYARTAGAAGNAITTTTDVTGATWSGATLIGGISIPTVTSFRCQNLPPLVTGVLSLTLVGRMRKSDSGDANAQMAFVTADNSSANGADRALTTTFTYYQDRIDTDPSTMGPISPTTFATSRIRFDRTS